MGTSDFDAVAAGSRSDLDPVSVTFRENAGEVLLPDRDVDVVAQEIGAPARRFDRPVARVDPAGVAGLEEGPVAADLADWHRHQADCELFDLLVEYRAMGVVWENVVEVLSAYASQVLVAWLRSGVIYTKLSSRHFGVRDWPAGRERLAGDHGYREEVIAHTVVRALEKLQFRCCRRVPGGGLRRGEPRSRLQRALPKRLGHDDQSHRRSPRPGLVPDMNRPRPQSGRW